MASGIYKITNIVNGKFYIENINIQEIIISNLNI